VKFFFDDGTLSNLVETSTSASEITESADWSNVT